MGKDVFNDILNSRLSMNEARYNMSLISNYEFFKEKERLENEPVLVFGWVSDGVISNHEAWASEKKFGHKEDADRFYYETVESAKPGQSWFCAEAK